jgi:mono/diheme cytochrome c family protein
MRRLSVLLSLLVCAMPVVAAQLTLDLGHGVRHLTTRQLLARPDLRRIDIPDDVGYHRAMHYRAVPLKALLAGVAPGDHVQFVALDGFAAEIDADLLLDGHGAQAWLAVEDPAAPWPSLGDGKPSAGPFYLVWTHPEAGHIVPEQWPYQIAGIRRLGSGIGQRFPAMQPDPALPSDAPARRGFAVFRKNCMVCHTLNDQGDARVGPDLNVPWSPTEYLRADLLRAYIRNPQSLRHYPQDRMPAFDRSILSDADLDALLAYLRHMAGRKTSDTGRR